MQHRFFHKNEAISLCGATTDYQASYYDQ